MKILYIVSLFGAGFFSVAALFASFDREWRDALMFVRFVGIWLAVAFAIHVLARVPR